MSNLEADREITDCASADVRPTPTWQLLAPQPVLLGPRQEVRRTLPHRDDG